MKSSNEKYVCAKKLRTQPPLEGRDLQLNASVYRRESWEEGRERSGSLRT